MRIPFKLIPPKIVTYYSIHKMVYNGCVYCEITGGMYGLKQAGRLASDHLILHLEPYGYFPCTITPGLWRHKTRSTVFTLVVDDFGIKYVCDNDLDHLINALQHKYTISIDKTGAKYCGLDLNWAYNNGTVDISMPGYIERALARFEHRKPQHQQHSPHPYTQPEFGTKVQFAPLPDNSKILPKKDITKIQEILGTLLYYARAVDSTLLVAISALSSEQTKSTEATMQKITHLLNYCATHPEATVRFHRSDMILHVESDASYLSESKARSRAAGYFYLSCAPNHPSKASSPADAAPPINGAITVLCNIMREVLSSASEAELAALYYNARESVSIRHALEEMGHPQPATAIVTDNSTAAGIINDTVRQRRSKAIDMRFYWLRDRSRQNQFTIYWKKGSLNRADYFSKHHPGKHHSDMRPTYLHTEDTSPSSLDCIADLAYCDIALHAFSDVSDDTDMFTAYLAVSDLLHLLNSSSNL
jgi:hypothetical protein